MPSRYIDRDSQIIILYLNGKNLYNISKIFNLSCSRISRIVIKEFQCHAYPKEIRSKYNIMGKWEKHTVLLIRKLWEEGKFRLIYNKTRQLLK